MIPLDLTTRREQLPDGSTAYPFEWRGETVLVRDGVDAALRVAALFADDGTDEESKAIEAVSTMFADPEDAVACCGYDVAEFGDLVDAVVWGVFGIDGTGGRASGAQLWDPVEDAAMIRVSLRMAYGIDWDEARASLPWGEFVHLVASLPPSTPLGRAIRYRDERTRPRPTKHNKEQVAEWDRLHRALALKGRGGAGAGDGAAESRAMDDFALALGGMARGGAARQD